MCKVGYNETRSLSRTFGKHELNLGIAQSLSTRRVEPNLRRCDQDRRALRLQPLELIAKSSRQIMDGCYVRALYEADVIELHRRWPAEATLSRAEWP
jgi:hypothetical protein